MKVRPRVLLLSMILLIMALTACGSTPTAPPSMPVPVESEPAGEVSAQEEKASHTIGVEGRLNIILEGEEGARQITATLLNTPAAGAFAAHLPLTYSMTDYANREKHALMGFSIDDPILENITTAYEVGDIVYYPPGPAFVMYYDHDGRTIAAGMEVIARMDQTGADVLRAYAGCVEVTVALAG